MKDATNPPRRQGSPALGRIGVVTIVTALLVAPAPLGATPGTPRPDPLTGVVVSEANGRALAGAEVRVRETGTRVATDAEGRFRIADLPPGSFTLEVSAEGFVPQERGVELAGGAGVPPLSIALVPLPRFLTEVVVTPSVYTLYASEPGVASSLSREEVERLPHLAQDVFRAARWLPGTAGEDFSAMINVRGGEVDETLVLLDGLEVEKAFHLEQVFGGLQSVVDADAIEDLEFMSGGFPVELGNRMSGVIRMSSTASGPARTTVGISTTHLGLQSAGPFADRRGHWLLSVRRTNLDNAIRWVDPDSGLDPLFHDVMGRVSYTLGDRTVLSASVLGAWDRTHYAEDSVEGGEPVSERMESTSSGRYAWIDLKTALARPLYFETLAWAGRLEREVTGSIDDWSQTGWVDDARSSHVFGLKQDWKLELGDRQLLKWGFDLRSAEARYDHASRTAIRDALFASADGEPIRERDFSLDAGGNAYAAYAADRLRLGRNVVAELGLRWDRQTYADDHQLSPRFNLAYTLGPRTTLRSAWGVYHQAQRIGELQVSDGLTRFQPAQRSEHRLLSLQHGFSAGYELRVDLYQKRLTSVRARYENLLNPVEIFPELEADRVLVVPERSEAAGIEAVLRKEGRRLDWWLSYALARTQDRIDGAWVPRSRDQPHTASFNVNWRPAGKWSLSLAGIYHTGWPTTAILAEAEPTAGGGVRLHPYLGPRNRARFPNYLRLDLRASRVFERGPGTWTVFLEVTNLLNRENPRGLRRIVDYYLDDVGTVQTIRAYRGGLPLLPSFGVRWSF